MTGIARTWLQDIRDLWKRKPAMTDHPSPNDWGVASRGDPNGVIDTFTKRPAHERDILNDARDLVDAYKDRSIFDLDPYLERLKHSVDQADQLDRACARKARVKIHGRGA